MGEKTGIAWCDHTFNPWIGCTKVSAGCQNCYAERDNIRYQWVKEWGKEYKRTGNTNWNKPIQWAKNAVKDGVIRRVFCASLADVFDLNAPDIWRSELWRLIQDTAEIGGLEWLILTKRPENISTRIPVQLTYSTSNVRLGVTTENQEMAEIRLQHLFTNWQGKNFISVEPMLGPVDLFMYMRQIKTGSVPNGPHGLHGGCPTPGEFGSCGCGIDWVICGGESGPGARPLHTYWVRSLRDQCVDAGVPFFFKQWGEWREKDSKETKDWASKTYYTSNQVMSIGDDQFFRIGKKNAGRLLDNEEWNEFPECKER